MPWEHGSILTLPTYAPSPAGAAPWGATPLYGSGRAALRALLRHGQKHHGWRRLLVPAYLCQEVVAAALGELPVIAYLDHPLISGPHDFPTVTGDALLVVNTLGLRQGPTWQIKPGVSVIEDHTHDPWSDWCRGSEADYALVALRKTLPLPDGAALWSPRGHALPPQPPRCPTHEALAERQLAAQLLKALYLQGHAIDKSSYLSLAAEAEAGIAEGEPVAMSRAGAALLPTFPTLAWREARRRHFEHGQAQLTAPLAQRGHQLLLPEPGAVAFALTMCFASRSARDHVRRALIERAIYPAILWDLSAPKLPLEAHVVELASRCLSIHCDYRGGLEDIDRVARHLLAAVSQSA